MDFERDGEVGSGFDEAVNPEFDVTLQAEHLNLGGMHESVEQGAFGDALVKHEDVEKRERVHVRDLGRIKTESAGLGEEFRHFKPRTLQFEDAHVLEEAGGEIRPHGSFQMRAEFVRHREITLALGVQVGGKPLDRLRDLLRSGLERRTGRLGRRNPGFEGSVKLVESTGGLGGLAENVAAAESSQIIGRIVKAKLVDSAVGAHEFEVSMLQIRVHLPGGGTVG